MTIRIGTQGWNYDMWRGPFYPVGTRPADYLTTYARAFDTVEVDSTFYAIPAASTVRGRADRTPAAFSFALKLPQEVTHERRFVAAGDTLALFCDRARALGEKLGPVLIQCSPDFGIAERAKLEEFLPLLPDDIAWAIEFRDRHWIETSIVDTLRAHRVSLALVDARWIPRASMLAAMQWPTADHLYVRFMGPDREITDYSRIQVDRTREIESWAHALRQLPASVVVRIYINNHFAGHSPYTARQLQRLVGQTPVEPAALETQLGLF